MSIIAEVDQDQLREKTVEAAKRHRASWIELGQYLFTIYKDKFYKRWSYLSFETYCQKELGIKQTTAGKLLKSYSFLEREEPRLTSPELTEADSPQQVPNYESVNLLRLAKDNNKLTPADYSMLRHSVLEAGKEPKEVKAQVKQLLADKEDKDPAEERRARRNASIKRMITTLTLARKECEADNLLPSYLLKQIKDLTGKLEDQLE